MRGADMSSPRPGRWRGLCLLVAMGLVASACVGSDRGNPEPTPRPSAPVSVVQARFESITGIRAGAPTVLGGVLLNVTDDPQPAAFTLSDIPAGIGLTSVTPAFVTGGAGGWSCAGLQCQLLDPTGAPSSIPPADAVTALVALSTPAALDPGSTVTVATNQNAPATVPLALPDGAAALGSNGLLAQFGVPPTVLVGTEVTGQFTVINPGSAEATGVVVALTAPAIDGVSVTAGGPAWSCQGLTCTLSEALAPVSTGPPLTVTVTSATGASGGGGSLGASVQATAGGAPTSASATLDLTVRPPRSHGVSTRVQLQPSSTPAPGTTTASVIVTATEQGLLSEPVSFTMALPDGVTASWDDVSVPGWTCSDSAASCQTPGPMVAGQPNVVTVPLVIAADARRTTARVEVTATVGTGDTARVEKPSVGSLVIVAPPVPELRPTLSASSTPAGSTSGPGAPVVFAAGAEQGFELALTNEGSVATAADAPLEVTASPSVPQRLRSVGGEGWSCTRRAGATISKERPLRCETRPGAGLAPGSALMVPFTVEPVGPTTVSWTVGAGSAERGGPTASSVTQVDVVVDSAVLTADVVANTPLYAGGSGRLTVTAGNHGTQPARGSVVVVAVPSGLEVRHVAAASWTCLDTTIGGANGTLTCATTSVIEPGTTAAPITLSVVPDRGTRRATLVAWAAAGGEHLASRASVARPVTFPVAGSLHVDAGQDLTVVTPQVGPGGGAEPAVVVLHGDADLASAKNLRWHQRCTRPGEPECGGAVDTPVAWAAVAAGRQPTTVTASFTAPTISTPEALHFELSGQVGTEVITDRVTVHLVPATTAALTAPVTTATSPTAAQGGGGPDPAGPATTTGPSTTTGPGAAAGSTTPPGAGAPDGSEAVGAAAPGDAPTASVATAGTALQVPTQSVGQLIGTGTGTGALTYQWTQTGGPTATLTGQSATQSTLVFTAPTLAPQDSGASLTFELTVTDATGATATATADVQVVWGDAGLQITLASGAPSVVADVGGAVAITSQITSRGAPYTYAWTVQGLTLPSQTAASDPTLAFPAGASPANGIATLTVTDAFGRQSSASVPVVVSALPGGSVPTAFCTAVTALSAQRSAQLTGPGLTITIPAATLSGAPASPCTAGTTATFGAATVTLPGGARVTAASGTLTAAGVAITAGTAGGPENWALVAPTLGPGGLFTPFASASALGAPQGSILANGLPLLGLVGAQGSTTVTFAAEPEPRAVLVAVGSGPVTGSSVELRGAATANGTVLTMISQGLLSIGPLPLSVNGTLRTIAGNSPTIYDTTATLPSAAALGADATLTSAQLAWTPTQATGAVGMTVGAGSTAVTLATTASVATDATTFSVEPATSRWSPAPGVELVLRGSGSLTGGQLSLDLTGTGASTVRVAEDLSLRDVAATLQSSCPLDASESCAPQFGVTATAESALFAAPSSLSGQVALDAEGLQLDGPVGDVTVAPMTVAGASLTVGLGLGPGAPSASAAGTAAVFGATVGATVAFGPSGTVATAGVGTQAIATGWTVEGLEVTATTTATNVASPPGALPTAVTLPVTPGELLAVGTTDIPAVLSGGVLPADLTTALASFTVSPGAAAPAGPYTLTAPLPAPWVVAGAPGAAMVVGIGTLVLTATPSPSGTTVAVGGSGTLTTQQLGGGSTAVDLAVTKGQLAAGPTGGVLTATLAPSGGNWDSLFGVAGLDATDVALAVTATTGTTTASLSGRTTLPGALADPLGVPPTARPALAAVIAGSTSCASIDLGSGGASGVDFGGAGLVLSPAASLVLAPQGCTLSGVTMPAGMTLQFDGTYLGLTQPDAPASVDLAVDPSTFAIDDDITDVTATIAGLALSTATIAVTTDDGTTAIEVQGQAPLDGTMVDVSGTVAMPPAPGQPGTITLAADLGTFTLGGTTFDETTVSTTGPSVAGTNEATVAVSGTISVLKAPLAVVLSGPLSSGSISQLSASLPSASYPLPGPGGADTLTASWSISYDTATSPTLAVTSTGATLTTPTQSFTDTDVTVTDASSLALSTEVSFLADGVVTSPPTPGGPTMTAVRGAYTIAGAGAGAYTLTNPTTVAATLAGLSQAATVTFARAVDGGSDTESATQSSTITTGLFDTDTPVTVTGPLSTIDPSSASTLASASPVPATVRGLSGAVGLSVSPSALATPAQNWFQVVATMTTDTGSCLLWQGNPVLSGQLYRTSDTTYYTLTGTVTPVLPLSVAALPAIGPQPLLLTNEVLPGTNQSANAITLEFPIDAASFTADAQISFGLSDCSYSLGGSATLVLAGGSAAQAIANALQPPAGVTASVNDLFGPAGQLPYNLQTERNLLQYEAMVHRFSRQATQAATAAADARTAQEDRQGDLADALSRQQAARTALADAEATLADKEAQLAKASTDADFADEFPLVENEIGDAQAALTSANEQVAAAQPAVDAANGRVSAAQTQVDTANDAVTEANANAADAQSTADTASQAASDANTAKLLQITVDITYCATCPQQFSGTLDGEAFFGPVLVATVDATFSWDPGFAFTLTASLGPEWIYGFSFGPVGVSLDATLSIGVTIGWGTAQGWGPISAQIDGSAQIDAWVDVFGYTLNADLLSIAVDGQLDFEPSTSASLSVSFEVFDFSITEQATWTPSS